MSAHAHVVIFDRAVGRWREAFEGALVVKSAGQALSRLGPGTVVWVDIAALDSLAAIRTARPDVAIVAMTLAPKAEEAVRALGAGARGYCHALAAPEMLRQVALVVSNGGLWLGPDLMSRAAVAVAQAVTPGARPALDVFEALTPRERAVALQVAEGASNKEIARRLDITLRTVKAHLSAIFDKLGVRDRLQLVLALRRSPDPQRVVREPDLTCTTVQ
jgi:two-component system, NarL family, nitrate/nitrite response regulator NarL